MPKKWPLRGFYRSRSLRLDGSGSMPAIFYRSGVFEVQAFGLVPGLGSHVSWEQRLDGRLAQAICSIQAVKLSCPAG